MRTTTRPIDRRLNDLTYADDITLRENDNQQAQNQLNVLKRHASPVGLEINIDKKEQMRSNLPINSQPISPLVINNKPINLVDEYKY